MDQHDYNSSQITSFQPVYSLASYEEGVEVVPLYKMGPPRPLSLSLFSILASLEAPLLQGHNLKSLISGPLLT